MSDITKNEWDKILKVLTKEGNDKELVEKVKKALKRTGDKEHERALRIIKAGVWYKKLVELVKQALSNGASVKQRRLGDSLTDAMVSISRPRVRRVMSGEEVLFESPNPVREISLTQMDEIQSEFLFKKLREDPPKLDDTVSLFYKISWDAWNEVHLTVTKDEISWRCPQWKDWETGKQSLKEAK
jgi:hypothetical protein